MRKSITKKISWMALTTVLSCCVFSIGHSQCFSSLANSDVFLTIEAVTASGCGGDGVGALESVIVINGTVMEFGSLSNNSTNSYNSPTDCATSSTVNIGSTSAGTTTVSVSLEAWEEDGCGDCSYGTGNFCNNDEDYASATGTVNITSQSGSFSLGCFTFAYSIICPCSTVIATECDGNPCTINDIQILDSGTQCSCTSGIVDPTSCDSACTSTSTTECDGNVCTVGDVQVLDSQGTQCSCTPGAVDATSCNTACTMTTTTECDGNVCTVGDVQVLAANGSQCSCTSGSVDATSCDPACTITSTTECDNSVCTVGDVQVLAADGSECSCTPGAVNATSCDPACTTTATIECDNDACTVGDVQVLAADGSECSCTPGSISNQLNDLTPDLCEDLAGSGSATTDLTALEESILDTSSGVAQTLNGSFAAGNGAAGNMFDLDATEAIQLTGLDLHIDNTASRTWEVYYIVGTHIGNEANAAAWTLLDNGTVTGVGSGNPTNITFATTLSIPASTTYALYVTLSDGSSLDYTNGTTVGGVWQTDGLLTIYEGSGLGYPFTTGGGPFAPRNWNGNIYYESLSCPQSVWTDATGATVSNPAAAVVNATTNPFTYTCNCVATIDFNILGVCDAGCTTTATIECDNDACTVGDVQVLAADGSECSCTSGSVDATSCDPACTITSTTECDNDLCTVGDVQVLAADGSECSCTPGPLTTPPPTPITTGLTLCETDPNGDLAATGLTADCSGQSITWYDQDPAGGTATQQGTGSPFDPTGTTAEEGALDVNTGGTYTYYVTCTENGCEGSATAVTIVVNAACDAACQAAPQMVECDGDPCTVGDMQVLGSDGLTECSCTSGAVDATSCDPACTTTTTIECDNDVCTFGDVQVLAADGSECSCTPGPLTTPDIPTATGLTLCETDPNGDLAATGLTADCSGQSITWYDQDPAGGTATQQGTGSPFDPTGTTAEEGALDVNTGGTYTYYVTCTENGCEGLATAVTVVVNAACDAACTTTATIECDGDPCTVGDMQVLGSDGLTECSCTSGAVDATSCDAACTTTATTECDGNVCTVGDVQVLAADGSECSCTPGAVQDCATGPTTTSVNECDGDPTTVDMQEILDCDGVTECSCVGTSSFSMFSISDPCICNNDESAPGAGDGTYGEIVEVLGVTGFMLRTDATTGTPPGPNVLFTENPSGSGIYQLAFNHDSDVGYTINDVEASNDGGAIWNSLGLTISNLCSFSTENTVIIECDGDPCTVGDVQILDAAGTPCSCTPGLLTPPAAPTATGLTFCETDPNGDAATGLTATGTATITWYDQDPTGGTATQQGTGSPFDPTGTTAEEGALDVNTGGTYTYYVTSTENGCEGMATAVTVVVNAACDAACQAAPQMVECDNNPCTIGDMQVLGSDGSECSCTPGAVEDCATGPTSTVAMECDGNSLTIDMLTTLDCDGSQCDCVVTPAFSTFTIADPCSCNNDESAPGAGDGTFSEVVEVVGITGFMLRTDAMTGTPPGPNVMFSENPPGSGIYQLMFDHDNSVGYTINDVEASDDGGTTWNSLGLSISNVCEYPTASIDPLPTGLACDSPVENLVATITDGLPGMGCPTAFTDISGAGVELNLGDDGEIGITTTNSYTFYGVSYTDFSIGNNGDFYPGTLTANSDFSNETIDGSGSNNNQGLPAIYPFWDDFYTNTTGNLGRVYWQEIGTQLIIQWNDLLDCCNSSTTPGDGITFQLILDSATGAITFVYDDVINAQDASHDNGGSASIGLDNGDGVNFTEFSFEDITFLSGGGCSVAYTPDGAGGYNPPTTQSSVTLMGTPATLVWSGPGVTDAGDNLNGTFDPALSGPGTHTITLTYIGIDDGNGGISPDGGTTPAYPGCEAIATYDVVVGACASILDPCVCLNELSPNGLSNQFDELVTVLSGPGEIWYLNQNTGLLNPADGITPYGAGLAVGPNFQPTANSGEYTLSGVHDDGVGYSIEVCEVFSGQCLSISNACFYPTISALQSPIELCEIDLPFDLDTQFTTDDGQGNAITGTFVYTNNADGSAITNPITALGTYLIDVSFISDGSTGNDVGCELTTQLQATITPSAEVNLTSIEFCDDPDLDITNIDLTTYNGLINAGATISWFFGDPLLGGIPIFPDIAVDLNVVASDLWVFVDDGVCPISAQISVDVESGTGVPAVTGLAICPGDPNGDLAATGLIAECPSVVADTQFDGLPFGVVDALDDALGTQSGTMDICPGGSDVVMNADDITVCIELYHTWSDDIVLTLTDPSGAVTETILDGGFLNDSDFGDVATATPFQYCFNSASANDIAADAVANDPITAGTYAPFSTTFSNFVGLPACGDWTLSITDGVGGDDGTIANATIAIAGVVPPTGGMSTATITWYDDPTAGTAQGTGSPFDPTGTTAEEGAFDATVPGTYTYYASCADPCEGDRTPVTVVVEAAPEAIDPALVFCSTDDLSSFDLTTLDGTVSPAGLPVMWVDGAGVPINSPSGADLPLIGLTNIFAVVDDAATGCSATVNITITIEPDSDPPIAAGLNICPGDPNGDLAAIGVTASCAGLTLAATVFDFDFPGDTALIVIDAGDGGSVTTTATFAAGSVVTGITVDVTMWHSWMDDVLISITSPGGTTVDIMDGVSIPTNADDIGMDTAPGETYTFDDAAAAILGIGGTATFDLAGTYQPTSPLSALAGEDPNGVWTINFGDDLDGDDGGFSSASITITAAEPSSGTPSTATITWYDDPTAGTAQGTGSPFDPTGTTAEEGAFDANTPGNYTYYVTCADPCESATRTPVIIVVEEPPVITDPDIAFCIGLTDMSYDLTQNDAVVGGGNPVEWYIGDPSTGGTLINPLMTVDLTDPTIVANGLFAQVTDATTGCIASALIPVSTTPDSDSPTVAGLTVCEGDPNGDIAATGLTASCISTGGGDPVSLDGDLTGVTDVYARPVDCGAALGAADHPYQAIIFTVDVSGTYDIISNQNDALPNQWDGYAFIYDGAFDPLNPDVGCLASDDDGSGGAGTSDIIGVSLTAGTIYTLVTTTFFSGGTGDTYTTALVGPGSAVTPSATTWWDAATGGTLVGSGSPLDPTGLTSEEGTVVDANTPGTYTFYAQCDDNGCPSARVAVVLVIEAAPVAVDPALMFCTPDDLTSYDLTQHDATVNGGSGLPVTWLDGNGNVINPATVADLPAIGLTSITAQVDDAATGCSSSVNIIITINPLPVVIATADTPCVGEVLTISETGSTAGVAWSWTTDGGSAIADPAAQTTTAAGAVDGDVFIVTVTTAAGCMAEASVTAAFSPLPAANDPMIMACDTDDLTSFDLTAFDAVVNGGAGNTVVWLDANGDVINPATAADLDVLLALGPISATVIDANACAASTAITVITNATAASPTVAGLTVCAGDPNGDITATGLTADCGGGSQTVGAFDFDAAAFPVVVENAGDAGSATVAVTFPTGATVSDLTVDVDMWHSWMSDVNISITSPAGTTVDIMDGTTNAGLDDLGPGSPADGTGASGSGSYTFTDAGASILGIGGTGSNDLEGTYQPASPFSAFAGEDPNGIWTINFSDDTDGDDGEFTAASLTITATQASPIAATWWDAAMGGTQVGSGSPFDPTGTTAEEGAFDATVPGTYTYYAECDMGNGCIGARVPVTVEVLAAPTVDAGGPYAKCPADALLLDGTVAGGAAPYTYAWTATGGSFDDATLEDPTYNMMAGGTYILTLTVSDANGCTATSDTEVTVEDMPTAEIALNSPICAGDDVVLAEISGGAVSTWDWTTDGTATFDDNTIANPVASGVSDGETITVVVTNAAGCTSTASVSIEVGEIDAGTDATICAGESTTLDATVLSAGSTGVFLGYTITDPCATIFTDISATGTALGLTDDGEAGIITTNTYSFYGTGYTDFTIGNNGDLYLGTLVASSDFLNENIDGSGSDSFGNAGLPGIFPFWDDLDAEIGDVYWQEIGTTLIVQWDDRPHFNGALAAAGDGMTLQVIWDSATGTITFVYDDVLNGLDAAFDFGASATIGLDAADGINFIESSFDDATLLSGTTCISYAPDVAETCAFNGWSMDGGATIFDTNLNTVVSPVATTTYTAVLTCGGVSCTDDVTITVQDGVVASDPNITACIDEDLASYDLTQHNGDVSATGTVEWYDGDPAAGGVLINPATAADIGVIGAGNVWAQVTDPATGCTSVVQVTISIFAQPTASIEVLGSVCERGDLVLNENGGDAVSWSWTTDGTATFNDATLQNPIALGATGSETITVTITDANGCTATDAITVAFDESPEANDPMLEFCVGDDLTSYDLTQWNTTVNTTGASVTWYSGDPFAGGTIINPAEVTDLPFIGLTNIWALVTDPLSSCSNAVNITITINALPTAVANASTVCEGSTVQLSEAGTGGIVWSWTTDGAAVITNPTDQNPVASGAADGDTFTVTVTNDNGCSATDAVTVTILPLPVVTPITIEVCEDEVCVDLTQYAGDFAPYGVQWYLGDPNAGGQLIFPLTCVSIPKLQQDDVWVLVIDENGCSSAAMISVVVNPVPIAIAGASGDCPGEDVLLTETGTGGIAWTWTTDGAATITSPTDQNPVASGAVDGETFTVVVMNDNGCTATDEITITLSDPVVINNPVIEVCVSDTMCLDLMSYNSQISTTGTVEWYDGDPFNGGTNIFPTSCVRLNKIDELWVLVTDDKGCTVAVEIIIIVNDNPVPIATATGMCPGAEVELSDTGTGCIVWMWTTSGGAVIADPSAPGTTASGAADGDVFTLVCENDSGCTATSEVTVMISDPIVLVSPVLEFCPSDTSCVNLDGLGGLVSTDGDVDWYNNDPANGGIMIFPVSCVSLNKIEDLWATVTDENGCTYAVDVIVNIIPIQITACPDDIIVTAGADCSADVMIPPVEFDACEGAVATNSYNGTADASDNYPLGVTTVTWTVSDSGGNSVTCDHTVTVTAPVGVMDTIIVLTIDTICMISDQDLFIDDVGFTANGNYPFTDPGTDPAATISDITLELYFRVAGNSCESDMEAQVFDPTGAMVASFPAGTIFTTCNGMGPGVGTLYNVTVPISSANVTGNMDDWIVEFNDSNGQNAGDEYSARFGRICYVATTADTTITTTASLAITTCPADAIAMAPVGACAANVNIAPVEFTSCIPATATNDYNGTGNASGSYPVGTTVVTWTVTDIAGNTATCETTVTVTGNDNPVFILCQGAASEIADPASCDANVTISQAIATDCGIVTVTNDYTGTDDASATYPIGTTTVTWTATDNDGNTVTCQTVVTVTEGGPTIVSCPADMTQGVDQGSCDAAVTVPALLANDCGQITITNSFNASGADASGTYPIGTTTVVWTVTDDDGNMATCSADIIVTDVGPTIVTCPTNIVQGVDVGTCSAAVSVPAPGTLGGLDAEDCGTITITNSHTGTADASGTYPIGTTTVVWTVTDDDGNTATCSTDITVIDDGPTIVTCPADMSVPAILNQCAANVMIPALVASDCGAFTITNDKSGTANASGVYPVGTTTVVWTVTDNDGNIATCSTDVTVVDDGPTAILCQGIVSGMADPATCEATVIVPPVSADECGTLTITNDYNNSANASDTYPIGTTTVVWTVTDNDGNTATCATNVIITDGGPTIVSCPADMTQGTDQGSCEATVSVPALSATDCGATIVTNDFNGSADASGTYPIGTTTVTWTVTDDDGNTATCSTDITVTDVGPIIVSCPADITVPVTPNQCVANVNVPALVADECGTVTVTNDKTGTANASGLYPVGMTTVVWIVTDNDGNTATCSTNVTVQDDGPEIGLCQGQILAETDAGSCEATVTIPELSTTDCSPVTITNSYNGTDNASGIYPLGETAVVWTVTDSDGNMATCETTVTVFEGMSTVVVMDTISVVSDQDAFIDDIGFANNPSTFYADPGTSASAVLSDIELLLYFRLEGASCEGDIDVQVTDPSGNTSTYPAIFGTGACIGGNALYTTTITIPAGMTTGVPGNWTVDFDDSNGQNAGVEYSVRLGVLTYIATTTTVVGGAPTITSCPADVMASAVAGTCAATVSIDLLEANDCGAITIINDYNGTDDASDSYPVGTTLVTWTVTDNDGNAVTCETTVTVADEAGPTIVACPDNIVVTAPNNGLCEADVNVPLLQAADCGITTITNDYTGTDDATSTYPVGSTIVTWTVADNDGNEVTCQQVVTVLGPITSADIEIVSDQDVFVDDVGFANNPAMTFIDPGTVAGASLTNIELTLFFKTEGISCESDIAINVYDPAGNLVDTYGPGTTNGPLFTTCFADPGMLHTVTVPILGGSTTGNIDFWTIEFDDTAGQNAGDEYSFRAGVLRYTASFNACGGPVFIADNTGDTDNIDSDDFETKVEETLVNDIHVYPVPAMSKLTLEYESEVNNENLLIEIFTNDGRVLLSSKEVAQEGLNNYNLDVTSLTAGTYFIRAIPANGVPKVKPFIKVSP